MQSIYLHAATTPLSRFYQAETQLICSIPVLALILKQSLTYFESNSVDRFAKLMIPGFWIAVMNENCT